MSRKREYFRPAYLLIFFVSICTIFAETVPDAAPLRKETVPAVQPQTAGRNIIHTVKPSESLFKIARAYGVSYPAIARANGIDNPHLIFAEQKLIVPLKIIIPQAMESGILINLPEFRLYLFKNGELAGIYPVCIGLVTWQTPLGTFSVINKIKDPAWYMPPGMAERENIKREIIPPGPDNPLGDRWIGTTIKHTGIHGTNMPMSIGKSLSHGCVRLYPEDIQKVFEEVEVGNPGIFLYEPVKVCTEGEEVLIEVHPDVYSLVPDIEKLAIEKLQEKNMLQKIHAGKMLEALQKSSGIPVPIGK